MHTCILRRTFRDKRPCVDFFIQFNRDTVQCQFRSTHSLCTKNEKQQYGACNCTENKNNT